MLRNRLFLFFSLIFATVVVAFIFIAKPSDQSNSSASSTPTVPHKGKRTASDLIPRLQDPSTKITESNAAESNEIGTPDAQRADSSALSTAPQPIHYSFEEESGLKRALPTWLPTHLTDVTNAAIVDYSFRADGLIEGTAIFHKTSVGTKEELVTHLNAQGLRLNEPNQFTSVHGNSIATLSKIPQSPGSIGLEFSHFESQCGGCPMCSDSKPTN